MKFTLTVALLSAIACSTPCCSDRAGTTTPATDSKPSSDPSSGSVPLPEGFNEYWFAGKAEICSYDVTQERYGEIRQAEQVNIFVTEDFSRAKQVKLDDPADVPADRVPVLKLNAVRRFHTGIYDYSILQSTFTPLNGLPCLKATTSVQDWCGQVFSQLNLGSGGYRYRGFSYFEGEGDQDLQLPVAQLEDALWARVRLNPFAIGTGKALLIPSALYSRLRHRPLAAHNAVIQLVKGAKESVLTVQYSDIPRTLSIRFETAFPHKISAWEETYEGKIASKGVLKAYRMSAYWQEHDNLHAPLRDSLNLRF